jgi:hypothetical protein
MKKTKKIIKKPEKNKDGMYYVDDPPEVSKDIYHRKLKSPCKNCKTNKIPKCIKSCKTLEYFQYKLKKIVIDRVAVDPDGESYSIVINND